MTLLNKSFKKRPVKEQVEKDLHDEVPSDFDEKSHKDRKVKLLEIGMWSISFLILLSVFGTSVYSYLLIGGYGSGEILKAESVVSLKYTSIPEKKEIYLFNDPSMSPDFSNVEASAVYAYNPVTQQVYYSSQIDQKSSIASITKLLTILVASEHFDKGDYLVASDMDLSGIDWRLGLKPGDRIKYEDAVKVMMINSYNDVAYIVAQNHPDGYEGFIKEMNSKAKSIGMDSSNFVNPAGLDDPDHFSTPRDLKRLIQLSLKNEMIVENAKKSSESVIVERLGPDGAHIVETIKLKSTNELLGSGDSSIVGLKTGYTKEAGQSFVGYFSGDGADKLITIILDANGDRFEETMDLLEEIRVVF